MGMASSSTAALTNNRSMSWLEKQSSILFVAAAALCPLVLPTSWRWLPLARQAVYCALSRCFFYVRHIVQYHRPPPQQQQLRTGTNRRSRPFFPWLSWSLLDSFGKDLSLFHDCQTRTLAHNANARTNNTTQDDRKCLPPDHGPPRRSKKRIEESIDGARNENDIEKHCCSDLL
jgi:hypothetical protein